MPPAGPKSEAMGLHPGTANLFRKSSEMLRRTLSERTQDPIGFARGGHPMPHSSPMLAEIFAPNSAKLVTQPLAAAIKLHARVKQTQTKLRGSATAELDALLDNLAEAAENYLARIARCAPARDRANHIAHDPGFPKPDRLGCGDPEVDITDLTAALAGFGDAMREASDEAAAFGDRDSSRLFAGMSRGIEYELWAMESHLAELRETERSRPSFRRASRCEQISFQKPCRFVRNGR
jgi:DNA-binding ferritin-like protein